MARKFETEPFERPRTDEWDGLEDGDPDQPVKGRSADHHHPSCEWVGLADDGEHVAICGKPAIGSLRDARGVRHWSCSSHISSIEAKLEVGGVRLRPHSPPARPYPEAIP